MITIEEEETSHLPTVVNEPEDIFYQRAGMLEKSQFLPKNMTQRTAAQVLAWSSNLGIPEAQALAGMSIIGGKPCIGADLLSAMAAACGIETKWIGEEVRKHCTYAFKGRQYPEWTEYTVNWELFKHLHSKDNWKHNPDAMLAARCLSRGLRRLYPGLFTGLYSPDEIQETTEPEITKATTLKGVDKAVALIEEGDAATPDADATH